MERRKSRRRQRNSRKNEKLDFQATEEASLVTVPLPRSLLVSAVLRCFFDSFDDNERLMKLLISFWGKLNRARAWYI
jgi:hypothetical protein